jgi:hypothetical protein
MESNREKCNAICVQNIHIFLGAQHNKDSDELDRLHAMHLSLKASHNIIKIPTCLFSSKSGITRKSSQVEDYKYISFPAKMLGFTLKPSGPRVQHRPEPTAPSLLPWH